MPHPTDQGQEQPPIVGIGASAGGIEALRRFFKTIPDDLGAAYVVIVHLAPDHDSELPAILARETRMPVTQVGDHDRESLQPNHVYVIAPDRKLQVTDAAVGASRFEQPRGQRSAIDLFFRSLAEVPGDIYAVVLSGGGSDGAQGARAIKAAGGLVLVQAPAADLSGSGGGRAGDGAVSLCPSRRRLPVSRQLGDGKRAILSPATSWTARSPRTASPARANTSVS
jgi:chemotaxis response regulator CheB